MQFLIRGAFKIVKTEARQNAHAKETWLVLFLY